MAWASRRARPGLGAGVQDVAATDVGGGVAGAVERIGLIPPTVVSVGRRDLTSTLAPSGTRMPAMSVSRVATREKELMESRVEGTC
jgi:hypothetical protein